MGKYVKIKSSNERNKIRVNITVDKDMLEKAKTKLNLFGGKLSTLFNVYLNDFVDSMDKKADEGYREILKKIDGVEERLNKLEKKD